MGQRGGKRPGAGRKPGLRIHVETRNPIKEAELLLADNLLALTKMALSIALEDRDKQMVVYCIDRVLGKAIQPVDILQQAATIAADFGVEPERVTSIVERLKAKRVG